MYLIDQRMISLAFFNHDFFLFLHLRMHIYFQSKYRRQLCLQIQYLSTTRLGYFSEIYCGVSKIGLCFVLMLKTQQKLTTIRKIVITASAINNNNNNKDGTVAKKKKNHESSWEHGRPNKVQYFLSITTHSKSF